MGYPIKNVIKQYFVDGISHQQMNACICVHSNLNDMENVWIIQLPLYPSIPDVKWYPYENIFHVLQ